MDGSSGRSPLAHSHPPGSAPPATGQPHHWSEMAHQETRVCSQGERYVCAYVVYTVHVYIHM